VGSIEYFTEVLDRQPLYPLNYHYIYDWEGIIYTDPVFEEAIFWSSPSLHTELRKLKDNTLKLENRNKVITSLYKYFLRVSSRCTPSGINAGFYIDNIGNEKSGSGVGSKGNRIVTPDLHFVNLLISFLSNIRELRSKMRFYKNPTIYTIGGTYRYFESYKKGKADAFRLSSVQAYPIIDAILSASTGMIYWTSWT